MRIGRVMGVAGLLMACLAARGQTGSAPAAVGAGGGAGGGRSLAISVMVEGAGGAAGAAGAGAAPVDCVVSCGPALPLSGVAFQPSGRLLAVGGYREVVLWDLVEGKLARRLGAGKITTQVPTLVFSKDGRAVLVGEGTPSVEGRVRVLDVDTGEVQAEFAEPKGVVNSLALSPDGKLLAAGCGDGAVYVWDWQEKKLVATLKEHTLGVLSVAFGQDGKYLASGSADKTAQVWEVATWKPSLRRSIAEDVIRRCQLRSTSTNRTSGEVTHMLALALGGRECCSIQTRPDGAAPSWARRDTHADIEVGTPLDCVWVGRGNNYKIYAACSDGTLKVFGETFFKVEQTATLRGHSDWVYGIAASADGARVASVSGDGTAKIWNVADNGLVATLVQVGPGADDWAVVTGRGYYAASAGVKVQWDTHGAKIAPEQLAALQSAEQVRQALAAKAVPPPVPQPKGP